MTAIIDTVNHAYGVEEGRSWWKVRLIAIALTIGVAIFVLASFALVIVGPQLAEPLARRTRSRTCARVDVANPGVADRMRTGEHRHRAGLLLRARRRSGVDVARAWDRLRHGALARVPRSASGTTSSTSRTTPRRYGALGGAMVLLLWFYMSGFVLLLGAVMNAKIEHAAPIGKNPGEKVEGQRAPDRTGCRCAGGLPPAVSVMSLRPQPTTFARRLSRSASRDQDLDRCPPIGIDIASGNRRSNHFIIDVCVCRRVDLDLTRAHCRKRQMSLASLDSILEVLRRARRDASRSPSRRTR